MYASPTASDVPQYRSPSYLTRLDKDTSGTTSASPPQAGGHTDTIADAAPHTANPEVYARAIVNATLTPQYETILAERNQLVRAKVEGTLNQVQQKRLAFLRWQIDRIEDAVGGAHLDMLESLIARHESLGAQIRELLEKLERASPTVFEPRKSRRR